MNEQSFTPGENVLVRLRVFEGSKPHVGEWEPAVFEHAPRRFGIYRWFHVIARGERWLVSDLDILPSAVIPRIPLTTGQIGFIYDNDGVRAFDYTANIQVKGETADHAIYLITMQRTANDIRACKDRLEDLQDTFNALTKLCATFATDAEVNTAAQKAGDAEVAATATVEEDDGDVGEVASSPLQLLHNDTTPKGVGALPAETKVQSAVSATANFGLVTREEISKAFFEPFKSASAQDPSRSPADAQDPSMPPELPGADPADATAEKFQDVVKTLRERYITLTPIAGESKTRAWDRATHKLGSTRGIKTDEGRRKWLDRARALIAVAYSSSSG